MQNSATSRLQTVHTMRRLMRATQPSTVIEMRCKTIYSGAMVVTLNFTQLSAILRCSRPRSKQIVHH